MCPAGQKLTRWSREEPRQRTRYCAPRRVCAACPLRSQCTSSKAPRQLSRVDLQEYIDWADSQGPRSWRRRLMGRRRFRAEGSFADAANNHGYKRARLRGLWKVGIQNVLIATIQNVRKLIRILRKRPANMQKAVLHAILAALRAVQEVMRPRQASAELFLAELR